MREKIQDKKTAVLQATLELIAEQGFHGTPMSQIAQKANIGVGTIYRYFPSKEDLINELYIQVKSRLTHFVFKNYSENMPVRESFIILFRTVIDYFIENPMDFLFMEQYDNSPLITVATRQESMRIFESASNLFIRAKEEALLRDLPTQMIHTLACGATKALANLYLFSEVKPDSATLDKGVEAVWDTISRH